MEKPNTRKMAAEIVEICDDTWVQEVNKIPKSMQDINFWLESETKDVKKLQKFSSPYLIEKLNGKMQAIQLIQKTISQSSTLIEIANSIAEDFNDIYRILIKAPIDEISIESATGAGNKEFALTLATAHAMLCALYEQEKGQ